MENQNQPEPSRTSPSSSLQGYQWLKEKIVSEEGTRQQLKLRELQALAERVGCTLPQLAIGNAPPSSVGLTAADSVLTRVRLLLCSLVPEERGRERRPAGGLQDRAAPGEPPGPAGQNVHLLEGTQQLQLSGGRLKG